MSLTFMKGSSGVGNWFSGSSTNRLRRRPRKRCGAQLIASERIDRDPIKDASSSSSGTRSTLKNTILTAQDTSMPATKRHRAEARVVLSQETNSEIRALLPPMHPRRQRWRLHHRSIRSVHKTTRKRLENSRKRRTSTYGDYAKSHRQQGITSPVHAILTAFTSAPQT